jgi:nucleoside-diphosphate-sugar epimerase
MKVLVIGNGFLGSEVIRKFLAEGFDVLVISRSAKREICQETIVGDFLTQDLLTSALDWLPDIIVQTAWITDHDKYLHAEVNEQYSNFTINLAVRTLNSSVKKLVILGSAAEYGSQVNPIVAGKSPLNPNSFYAEQKVKAFEGVRESLQGSGVDVHWGRVFQPYGYGQDERRLMPYLVKSLSSKVPIHLKNPYSCLDWITSRDVASAVLWTVRNNLPIELDIATGIGTSNLDLLKTAQNALGLPRIDPNKLTVNFDEPPLNLVASALSPIFTSGWRPSDELSEGIRWAADL